MATIDDIGDTTEPLGQPLLGGPNGWAAAVRDYLKGMVVQKAGDTMTGWLSVPAVKLNPGPSSVNLYGDAANGLVVRPGDDVGFAPASIGEPTQSFHAATKGYVNDGPPGGVWYGVREAASHGANNTGPFNFTETHKLFGRENDEWFHPLTDGYVRIRQSGLYRFEGNIGWEWGGDSTSAPSTGPVFHTLYADQYFFPWVWLDTVSSGVARAFGGAWISTGVNLYLANLFLPAPVGSTPTNVKATITATLQDAA